MDANDAASYVQDLAGENANIIFGAKYDESMTDEASITVIATGLEDVSAQAPTPAPATTAGMSSTIAGRMVYPHTQTTTARTAGVGTAAAGVPHTPVQPTNTTPGVTPVQPAHTYTGIQKPRQPESSVKPVEITIPDFLKNTRR